MTNRQRRRKVQMSEGYSAIRISTLRLPRTPFRAKKGALSMHEVLEPSATPDQAVAPLEPIRVRAKFCFEGDKKWFIKGVT